MASPTLAQHLAGIPRSGIREVFDRCASMPEVHSLAVGEPSHAVPRTAELAAHRSVLEGMVHYTDVLGVEPFRRAAVGYAARVKGLHYDPDTEVQAIPGATFGLYLTLRALLDPGDEVIVPSPAFTSYGPQVQLAGGRVVEVALRPENGMRLDAADIARAVTPRTRAVLLNSPANPVGAVTGLDELAAVAAVCQEHDLWAISDEVYHPFVYGPGAQVMGTCGLPVAPSIAAVPGMHERTVVVDSLSKTHAMTGWRIGYLLAPARLIEATSTLAELVHSSINAPAQYAAAVALDGPVEQIAQAREAYRRRREVVLAGLAEVPELTCVAPDGAFYAFLDVRATGLGSQDFADGLLMTEHVAVVPGEAFGAAGAGFVRLSYAGSEQDVADATARLVRFAVGLRERSGDLALAGRS